LSVLIAARHDVSKHQFITADLAAYLEWYWLRSAGHQLGSLIRTPQFEDLHVQLKARRETWWSADATSMGFIRVRRKHTDWSYLAWVQFRFELQRTLITSGFSQQWAKQIVGALGELEDNIHTHSDAAHTGLIVYRVSGEELECIILDLGVGVLASLRSCDEFGTLKDHGTALQIVLANGNSRYGTASGRGWGFHELFVGLVNSTARLRFRSGDHLLSIEGEPPHSLAAAGIRQRAHGQGFMVALRATAG
jgi:anti-sigma regulatory factor (Ser/Thr protein kinase)